MLKFEVPAERLFGTTSIVGVRAVMGKGVPDACGPRWSPGVLSMSFTLTSPAFEPGEAIPQRYTCEGDDISPPLEWAHTTPPWPLWTPCHTARQCRPIVLLQGESLRKDAGGWHSKGGEIFAEQAHDDWWPAQENVALADIGYDTLEIVTRGSLPESVKGGWLSSLRM
jgi:hypothetical protein